jgi:signal peptidase
MSKKVLILSANILSGLLVIFIIMFSVMAIGYRTNGYNNIFGFSWFSAPNNNMAGDSDSNFNQGDRVVFKILSPNQKGTAQAGEVILYFNSAGELTTGRVTSVFPASASYNVRSDSSPATHTINFGRVVGVHHSTTSGGGGAVNFMLSNSGYVVFIIVPSVLVLGYLATMFVLNFKALQKQKELEKIAGEVDNDVRCETSPPKRDFPSLRSPSLANAKAFDGSVGDGSQNDEKNDEVQD